MQVISNPFRIAPCPASRPAVCISVCLTIVLGTSAWVPVLSAPAKNLPDINSVAPDLKVPVMESAAPAPGKRVKVIDREFKETDIYHTLYLPADWVKGRNYPVIVEYAGNKWRTSLGTVEGSKLGYGITGGKGAIWVCMPFVDIKNKRNAKTWWGNVDATVAYCKKTVKSICDDYGGDSSAVFIAGFSRGAIACNFIGLADDQIASLWAGFICHSHYDGVRKWGYPGSDRASALKRLKRLGDRPQFVSHERSVEETQDYLKAVYPEGNFTFQALDFNNHTDTWVLRDIPERKAVRKWFNRVLKKRGEAADSASSGSSSSAVAVGNNRMLPQSGNPINKALDNYKRWLRGSLSADKKLADAVISWQLDNGAFHKWGVKKYASIAKPAEAKKSAERVRHLGTIDNDATTTELMVLADVYRRGRQDRHRAAARKTLDYLLTAQNSQSGGWPQFYPDRSKDSYSNHATFNDNAMMRVLILLQKAQRRQSPFDTDMLTADQLKRIDTAIDKGIDFILKSQIRMNGVLTVWCAQHGMVDYKPKTARSYELPSKSGSESVLVVAFLMSRPQTPKVAQAARAAVAWFRNPQVYHSDHTYDTSKTNPIVRKKGSRIWYRFYDLETNRGFFSGRDGIKKYNIMEIEAERREGYRWAGTWGEKILSYADRVGY